MIMCKVFLVWCSIHCFILSTSSSHFPDCHEFLNFVLFPNTRLYGRCNFSIIINKSYYYHIYYFDNQSLHIFWLIISQDWLLFKVVMKTSLPGRHLYSKFVMSYIWKCFKNYTGCVWASGRMVQTICITLKSAGLILELYYMILYFRFLDLFRYRQLYDCFCRVAECSIRVYQSLTGRPSLTGFDHLVGNQAVFELPVCHAGRRSFFIFHKVMVQHLKGTFENWLPGF